MTPPMTGAELRRYREEKKLSLEELGDLIGGKAATTIMRWENGQEIPGDTQILLKLLIRGEMPFTDVVVPSSLREAMWELEMSLGTWEEINRRRIAAGFATVTDWLAALVKEKLGEPKASLIDNLNPNLVNTGACAQNSSGAAAATFTDIAPKNPLRPGLGATIVPLPETHWAPPVERLHAGGGSQESLAAEKAPGDGSEAPELPERREARYEPPAKKRKK